MICSQRLLAWLMLAVCATLIGCGEAPPRTARHPAPVIILALDTMRGDHLRAAGHDSIWTPFLDALARDGVLFTDCQTTAPWTGPSFASVMTGLLPYRHGFLGGDYGRLADEFVTLPEILTEVGFDTGSFVSVKWLTEFFGMTQGWQEKYSYFDDGTGQSAVKLSQQGVHFARRHQANPFLLLVHYYDVHAPYTPPAPFDRMYYEGDPFGPGEPLLDFLKSDRARMLDRSANARQYDWLEGVTDWQYPVRQYAAGVTHVDDHVGCVLRGLVDLGVYDRAMIIVLSDHGEHLGEHDFWFTHALPYRETMHVPLIIKFPGGRHAGQVVRQPVSLLDITPTILATVGVDAPDGLDGVDLTPLIGAPDAPSRSALVAEQGNREDAFTKALIEGTWKLLLTVDGETTTVELYDVAQDPLETEDVAAHHPDVVDRLTRRLWTICGGDSRLTVAAPAATREIPAADLEKLRSLGYVH